MILIGIQFHKNFPCLSYASDTFSSNVVRSPAIFVEAALTQNGGGRRCRAACIFHKQQTIICIYITDIYSIMRTMAIYSSAKEIFFQLFFVRNYAQGATSLRLYLLVRCYTRGGGTPPPLPHATISTYVPAISYIRGGSSLRLYFLPQPVFSCDATSSPNGTV